MQTARGVKAAGHPFSELCRYQPLSPMQMRLYQSLREAVPIIDAAILKTVRLVGGFTAACRDKAAEAALRGFLRTVRVNACSVGMESFVSAYFEQLLTYGTAVGEIVLNRDKDGIAGLYNASLEDVELKAPHGPMCVQVCLKDGVLSTPVPYPELILTSALSPEPGALYGDSVLKGLPFVSEILLKIYQSMGLNWERVGNLRFAVTYHPGNDPADKAYAKERAEQMAREWGRAMQGENGRVSDFVAVGDVSVKVIGADNQILDSEVPVRQMLEQIVAKLSLPPFLLGLSWSSTERMSSQQADILTSELGSYRRLLTPVIEKVCNTFLRLNGFSCPVELVWDKINLQDEVELANARLLRAQAEEIERRLAGETQEESQE